MSARGVERHGVTRGQKGGPLMAAWWYREAGCGGEGLWVWWCGEAMGVVVERLWVGVVVVERRTGEEAGDGASELLLRNDA